MILTTSERPKQSRARDNVEGIWCGQCSEGHQTPTQLRWEQKARIKGHNQGLEAGRKIGKETEEKLV